MRIPRVLAFHAEKLHDDLIWSRVKPIAHWMARKGIKATFFVYPYRAQVVDKDITERVRELAALGHEIGQHTHFYAGAKIDKPQKANDLSDANIIYCLRRDFDTLNRIGVPPKGFTAGSWVVNQTVRDTLVELCFNYDCSAQFPKPKKMADSSYHCWLRYPQFYTNARGKLLCLPTTCSLGEWFKWGRKLRMQSKVSYQLIYLHDYDLLSFRNRLMLSCLLKICTRQTHKPLAILAQEDLF